MERSSSQSFQRTTRGISLDVSLGNTPRGRQGRALAEALRAAVLAGTLAPDSALPSSRRLADDLGVSRGMVVNAYAQLVAEGYLVAHHGGGTRVAGHRSGLPGAGRTVLRTPIPITQIAGHNPGQPDPALFPRRDWISAMTAAISVLPDAAFVYGDMRGSKELRCTLATYLGRIRSISTDAEQIIIVNGFAQSLACIVNLLLRRDPSAVIAVEDPGSSGVVEQLRWWGARLVYVPVDSQGISVDALESTKAVAVVVTPAHHYPTGVTLSASRRHALIDWARQRNGFIIEDDYDAEYRYDRQPLTSLHALGPAHVIATGSVSKSLSPALRLGWMVVPDELVVPLAEVKANMDLGTALLPQATLAEFIRNGAMDRHLRRSRARYRTRRDALVNTLLAGAPNLTVAGIAAGLHVLVHLDPELDEDEVAETARRLGFVAQPLSHYRHRPGPPGLVLGYAAMRPEHIVDRAAKLAAHIVSGTNHE